MNNSGPTKPKECKNARLAEAISDGRLYQTKMILDDQPNLNYIDKDGLSPLMRAFRIPDEKHRTRTAMVKLLLQHKVDVNLKDSDQRHALTWACKMNKLDLVKLVFAYCLQDVDMTAQDVYGNTPLLYAVQNNNISMVQLIVNAMKKFSLNVDQRNVKDKTAYYTAVELGFTGCAQILADVGRASQGIKVNPFLDFLVTENADYQVRANTAPPAVTKSSGVSIAPRRLKRRNAKIGNAKVAGNRKRGNRSTKPGKTYNGFTATQSENLKLPKANGERILARNDLKATQCRSERPTKETVPTLRVEIEHIDRLSPTPSGRSRHSSTAGIRPPSSQDGFLWLILDEEKSEGQRSRSPMSSISVSPRTISPVNNLQVPKKSAVNNMITFPQGHRDSNPLSVINPRYFTRLPGYTSTKPEPQYSAYSEWRANIDYPPNTLRNLLALRAEQQAEISSYRKGLVIPKYVPGPDESAEDRSAAEVLSATSEKSTRSEATKKVIAVAKTIGLSAYLAKRKGSTTKKD